MGADRLMKTPCVVLRRTPGDEEEFGAPGATTVEVETHCALQQQRRNEHDQHGELSDTLWDLFLPFGTEIDTGDAVVVRAREYELVGEPWNAEEGSRSLWHVAATVRRTAGTGE
jgi:hypothetical protein